MAIALPPLVGLDFWEIVISVGGGSITGVIIFTFFGKIISGWLANHFKRTKPLKFSRRRILVKIWKQFGLAGVAFLTPFISPPISVAIALSFRSDPKKIILYISISLFIWAVICAVFRDAISDLAGWGVGTQVVD